jgi:hypothetical protein
MQTQRRFDRNAPEIAAYLREVREKTFTSEGMMVAFPTCMPGASVPMALDESRITALDITPAGTIFGGTSGRRTHLFVADFHAESGLVFDLGVVSGATSCAAVCCGAGTLLALVNGDRGGRAISTRLTPAPRGFIQEWGISRPPLNDLGECVPGEPVVHATATPQGVVVGGTRNHLFTVDLKAPKVEVLGEAPVSGRVAVAANGAVVGFESATHLWSFDPGARVIRRRAVALPAGSWGKAAVWARASQGGLLYTADAEGKLFSFDGQGFNGPLGRAPLAPVGPMAVTVDGRLFGFCGEEIAKMFCYNPRNREVTTLGVAVSVIERRRYGYEFGDAVTGRDGEIIFGENDNGGHLWLYFPRIQADRA